MTYKVENCGTGSQGLQAEVRALDAYKTMQAGFAAEISERERRIVKISEME